MFEELGPIPFDIPSPFEEPPQLAKLRAFDGLPRMRTSTGDFGWLVTRYSDVKELCADQRIGKSHTDPDRAPRLWDARLFTPVGDPRTEIPEHRALRRLLADGFCPRRIKAAHERTVAILHRTLDDVIAAGRPAELCSALAVPFAVRVISAFVGFPREDEERILSWTAAMRVAAGGDGGNTDHVPRTYLDRLLDIKRREPGDDVVSLLATLEGEEPLKALSSFAVADYETIAARIGYGILFMLAHPEQRRLFEGDPSVIPTAVEEILRLAVPGGSWIPRYALTDLDHRGNRIRAGDLVVFSIQSANRDERQFPDAHVFVVDRSPNPHIGFGYGKFYCLGAGLVRLMLRTALPAIFARLPNLRLAIPVDEVRIDAEKPTGGLTALPVMWD
jgi:cytochrome P450 monooxygenase